MKGAQYISITELMPIAYEYVYIAYYHTCIFCIGEEVPEPECDTDEVQCPNGDCIPTRYICDGLEDCPSGWDEESCIPAEGRGQTRFLRTYLTAYYTTS